MKKNTTEIQVTGWMKFKAQGKMRWALIQKFLKQFFGIRELVYVHFEYELRRHTKEGEVDKHRMPEQDTHIVLAWVSRDTPLSKVQKLFTLKAPINKSLKITGTKIVPLGKVPRV